MKMASWEQWEHFSRSRDMRGPGIYLISTVPAPAGLLKLGFSKNLEQRLRSYKKNLSGALRIEAVARLPGARSDFTGRRPVRDAERRLLDALKDDIWTNNEWVRGDSREKAVNEFAKAHSLFAQDTPHGQALFLGSDIASNRKDNRTHFNVTRDGTVVQTLRLTDQGGRQYQRLRRVLSKTY